jgi:lipoyl(octanoyl) transferase
MPDSQVPAPEILDWGLIDYETAVQKQLELVDEVSADENHKGYLIFCTHPPVVTTGRQTQPMDVFAWKGPVIEVSRGGRATYHGPSQLVIYPVLNLKKPRHGRSPQEIRGYIRTFEQSIVDILKLYNVEATGKTSQKLEGATAETDETGVWVGSKKIASLGIAVKKWTTYHGAAINLDYDPEAFMGLNPCGFNSSTMISLEQLTGKKINRSEFQNQLSKLLIRTL